MSAEKINSNKETGIAIVSSLLNNKAADTKELIKNIIIRGEAIPSYVAVVLKKFAKVSEEVKNDKELWNLIEEDVKKNQEGSKKTFTLYGAKVTIASRSFWDYSETQDPLLEKLQEISNIVSEQIKARQEELQAKSEAWQKLNTPTGGQKFGISSFTVTWENLPKLEWEEAIGSIETNPPIKRSTDQLRFSL